MLSSGNFFLRAGAVRLSHSLESGGWTGDGAELYPGMLLESGLVVTAPDLSLTT